MSDELKRRPLLMRVLEAMQEADNYYVSLDQAQVAIALIRAETLEEAARVVPTTWLDPLLTGPGATELPLDGPGVEKLCRGITAAIRALKDTPA